MMTLGPGVAQREVLEQVDEGSMALNFCSKIKRQRVLSGLALMLLAGAISGASGENNLELYSKVKLSPFVSNLSKSSSGSNESSDSNCARLLDRAFHAAQGGPPNPFAEPNTLDNPESAHWVEVDLSEVSQGLFLRLTEISDSPANLANSADLADLANSVEAQYGEVYLYNNHQGHPVVDVLRYRDGARTKNEFLSLGGKSPSRGQLPVYRIEAYLTDQMEKGLSQFRRRHLRHLRRH